MYEFDKDLQNFVKIGFKPWIRTVHIIGPHYGNQWNKEQRFCIRLLRHLDFKKQIMTKYSRTVA